MNFENIYYDDNRENNFTISKAMSILSLLSNNIDPVNFSIDAYSNGREQGLSITNYLADKKVSFSEYRSYDSIAVYYGKMKDFTTNNVPNDDVYRKVIFFQYKSFTAAVEFIEKYLEISS